MHRDGEQAVLRLLVQSSALEPEPRQVAFVRTYSNYLTPRSGLFAVMPGRQSRECGATCC